MQVHPEVQLSRLRDIGFGEWDPIGILAPGATWKDHPAADEYDSYLLQIVSRLRSGASKADAIDDLILVESEHMGLGITDLTRDRATRTVRAIHEYLVTLHDGPA